MPRSYFSFRKYKIHEIIISCKLCFERGTSQGIAEKLHLFSGVHSFFSCKCYITGLIGSFNKMISRLCRINPEVITYTYLSHVPNWVPLIAEAFLSIFYTCKVANLVTVTKVRFDLLNAKVRKHFREILYLWGTRWRSRSRHCATSREVAGSIPDSVIGIFHWHDPSCRTMVLGLTQPPTDVNTSNISCWVKAAGAQGWQPYHLHVIIVLKYGSLNLLESSGPVQACNGIALPFYLICDRFVMNLPTWTPDDFHLRTVFTFRQFENLATYYMIQTQLKLAWNLSLLCSSSICYTRVHFKHLMQTREQ